MSKGHGNQERRILEATNGGFVWLASLAPDTHGAEYKALHRAARRLEDKGEIVVYRYRMGRKQTLIGPKGTPQPAQRPGGYD